MSDPVLLVNPPFGAIERPSIGLGLLQTSAKNAGIDCRCIYANLMFAERIGLDVYFWFANTGDYTNLFGEWVFAESVFPGAAFDADAYIREFVLHQYTGGTFQILMPEGNVRQTLLRTRATANAFVDDLAREIVAKHPKVVGCTSSFQQNCCSLALLGHIRDLDDTIVTVLGGPNCEGPMGKALRRHFPCVDFVVSGEADESFPDFVRAAISDGRGLHEKALPEGYIGPERAADRISTAQRLILNDLDTAPVPNYDDYFDQVVASGFTNQISPGLLIETSRGCWWGQKRPCTFCGLNGLTRQYRRKSPERVEQECNLLCTRYSCKNVEFVDNNVEPRMLRRLFGSGKDRSSDTTIFFETRVLDRPTLQHISKNGVRWLQVGIESFDDRVLSLMNKGTTLLENIQHLRWAYEFGIRVTYNIIYGFPGEKQEWLEETGRLMPLLTHLEPPRHMVPLRYDRFSEYCENPERYGLNLIPRKAYGYVYPLALADIAELAYFFEDANHSANRLDTGGLETLKKEWLAWRFAFWTAEPGRERAVLHLLGNERIVYDTRPCAANTIFELPDLETHILKFCDSVRSLDEIMTACRSISVGNAAKISDAVQALVDKRILLSSEGRFLCLAVTPPEQPLLQTKDFPGGFYFPTMPKVALSTSLGMPMSPR